MKIHLLDDLYEKEFNASYKAKIDVNNVVLNKMKGSSIFSFYRFTIPNLGKKNRLLRYLRLRLLFRINQLNFLKFFKGVDQGDIVIIPFPFEFQWFVLVTSYIYQSLKKLKNKKNVKVIFVVHDLVSLRFPDLDCEDDEIPLMDIADAIILHNQTMIDWLTSKGVSKDKLVNLQVFDYLSPAPAVSDNELSNQHIVKRKVIYAGNLMPWKTEFIYKWKPDYDVELYGVGLESKSVHPRISYRGVFNPDSPVIDTSGISFGLVWDGPSADELIGPGAYLRYNNPHKISLYLSQDLPVIVSKESALAPFVLENKLGFTISNLSDISEVINNMTEESYIEIRDHVKVVGRKIRQGGFMENALNQALKKLK